jgi:hypothetical protein
MVSCTVHSLSECQSHVRTAVFISYSRRDAKWLRRLCVHLRPLEREHKIEIWDDTKIKPGTKWREEIRKALAAAKVAVLLVSADFLASDFIATDELPPLLSAAEKDGAVILPIILSPSRFTRITSLAQFQTLNNPSKPLVGMTRESQESILVKATEAIEVALNCSPETVPERVQKGGATMHGEVVGGETGNTRVLPRGDTLNQNATKRTKSLWAHPSVWAAIIAGVVGLITAYWQFINKSPQPDKVKTVSYIGRVRDEQTNNPIYRAKVSIEVARKVPQVQETDSDGVFHVSLPDDTTEARIIVEATGYESRERRAPLTRTGVEEIRLRPIILAQSTSKPPATPGNVRRSRGAKPVTRSQAVKDDCSSDDMLLGLCRPKSGKRQEE